MDFTIPIILRWSFLATSRALVDVDSGELKFRLKSDNVKFNVFQLMKQPRDMSDVSISDVAVEEVIETSIKQRFIIETLAAVIMLFDDEFREYYVETINALQGM